MVGIVEGLAEKSRAKYDRRFTHELQLVATTGKRLGAMLTNLVDFAALRTGTIVLERRAVDLHSLVDVVIAMLGPVIGEKKLTVANQVSIALPALFADEVRVQQVLVNLLSNAVRYTTAGKVTVSARVDGDLIELVVADTGPGLSPRALKSLLDPSVELSAEPDLDVRTSGLGVRVCKQLVELHGGVFVASSLVGTGSVFGFRIAWTSDAPSTEIVETNGESSDRDRGRERGHDRSLRRGAKARPRRALSAKSARTPEPQRARKARTSPARLAGACAPHGTSQRGLRRGRCRRAGPFLDPRVPAHAVEHPRRENERHGAGVPCAHRRR
jgi:hypothetical protein